MIMVQVRKSDGTFGGRATDIKKRDVDAAIRMIVEEQADVSMRIKTPVKIDMNLADIHIYHHTEFDELFFKGSMAILALTGTAFLIWWMVIR